MKQLVFLLMFLVVITTNTHAQRKQVLAQTIYDKTSVGLGGGLDYGGLGVNGLHYFNKNIGAFLGIGYPLVAIGFNAGIKYRFVQKDEAKKAIPFVTAMYGYNAALNVDASFSSGSLSSRYTDKGIYIGPSFGAGFDTKYTDMKKGYWTFSALIPIRSKAFYNRVDYYKSLGVNFVVPPLPIAISIGYRFVIK